MSQRKLFEEVGEKGRAEQPRPETGAIARGQRQPGRGLRLWLLALLVIVAATVIIGGLGRLAGLAPGGATGGAAGSDPGVSLLVWAWQGGAGLAFAVWLVGFVAFRLAGHVPPGWGGRLFAIGPLSAALAALGRWGDAGGGGGGGDGLGLAAHLGLAYGAFGLILWSLLALRRSEAERMRARRAGEGRLRRLASLALVLALVQILLGGLLAANGGGRMFADWPLMEGRLLAPGAFELKPLWRNFLENPALVQFLHRLVAYVLVAVSLWAWLRARRSPNRATRSAFAFAAIMVLIQAVLGIVSLMLGVPAHGAITHQLGALFSWLILIVARHQAAYPVTQSIRG